MKEKNCYIIALLICVVFLLFLIVNLTSVRNANGQEKTLPRGSIMPASLKLEFAKDFTPKQIITYEFEQANFHMLLLSALTPTKTRGVMASTAYFFIDKKTEKYEKVEIYHCVVNPGKKRFTDFMVPFHLYARYGTDSPNKIPKQIKKDFAILEKHLSNKKTRFVSDEKLIKQLDGWIQTMNAFVK